MAGPRIPGTVVILTGAARGLGRAMTLGLAEAGAAVGALYRASGAGEMRRLTETAKGQGFGDRILPIEADVTSPEDCARAVETTIGRFGPVGGLVNNAAQGMQAIGKDKKFYEVDIDAWRRAIDSNVNGPFLMAKLLAPRMVARGWGRIVNVGSNYRTMQGAGFSPYGPSKAAVEAASVIWAKDLAGTGVTVNVLLPGSRADTQMVTRDEIADRSKLVRPEVMVAPVVWLMSRESDGVSGQRFVAKDWDPRLDPKEAAARSGTRAGWQ